MMKVLAQRLRDVQLSKSLEGQNTMSLGFSEDMRRSSATLMQPMLVRRNCLHVFSLAQQAPFLPALCGKMDYAALWSFFHSLRLRITGIVRPKVEASAKAEARAASEEDKSYEKARNELSMAMRAVDVAAKAIDTAVATCLLRMSITDLVRDDHVFSLMRDINKVITRKHKALEKVSMAKPKLGLARMKHARVYRICFQLAICMNFTTWVCAGAAFYRSIELQMGKSARADTIACFATLIILAAGLHGYYLRLASFED